MIVMGSRVVKGRMMPGMVTVVTVGGTGLARVDVVNTAVAARAVAMNLITGILELRMKFVDSEDC